MADLQSAQNILFYGLWRLLHLIITIYSCCLSLLQRINFTARFLHFYHSHRGLALTKCDRQALTKVPTHLGIVFSGDPSDFSPANVANLVTWSSGFGIRFVSVYDRHGFWHERRQALQALVEKATATSLTPRTSDCVEIVSSGERLLNSVTNDSLPNGFTVLTDTIVMFLTERNGKAAIAAAASDICQEIRDSRLDVMSVDQQLVDSFIRRGQLFPDPDLVIRVGSLDSLSGYLPWHVRLTEIVLSNCRTDLSYRTFLKALWRYSHVEQRIGR